MKLIIDIPNYNLNNIQNGSIACSQILKAVKNGIPYEPKGDLIKGGINNTISINDLVNLAVYGGKYRAIVISCNKYSTGISFSLRDLDRINPKMLDFPVNAILPSDTVNNGLELVVDDVHFEKINRIRN